MQNDILHHARDETLAAYASAGLDEARSVVIATHLAMCARCRRAARDFEALGGAVLETAEPQAMSESALDIFWTRAGAQDRTAPPSTRAANDFSIDAAHPLAAYLKGGLDGIRWRPIAFGLSQHVLPAQGYRPGVLRLLKIAPGVGVPLHTHADEELTLILRGAYRDEIGDFRAGDLADLGDETVHAPRAMEGEHCICLIAASGPLKFKTLMGRAFQPFVGL